MGYYVLRNPASQERLHWGKSPTPLQRLCDLPFRYFADPRSRHILFPTLVSAAAGCPKNRVRACALLSSSTSTSSSVSSQAHTHARARVVLVGVIGVVGWLGGWVVG